MIKKIKIFSNKKKKLLDLSKIVEDKLIKAGFIILDDADLVIAIGGDGDFLNMLKNTNYNFNIYYVGINTGTLGFFYKRLIL